MESPHDLHRPTPHAMGVFAGLCDRYDVVAVRDIVDARGAKLWAHGQRVTASLQERLLQRKLIWPLETCLHARDGVDQPGLCGLLEQLLAEASPLTEMVRPHAQALRAQMRELPLHAVARLMLTATTSVSASALRHAVDAMALSGAMAMALGLGAGEIRCCMLAGLLHDVGEIYVEPGLRDQAEPLDLPQFRRVAAHPRIAQLLLQGATDYPAEVARAVAEHHERLDGSGYPARLGEREMSAIGRLLCIAEATLGVLRASAQTGIADAALALRIVPGEFDLRLAALQFESLRRAPRQGDAGVPEPCEAPVAGLGQQIEAVHALAARTRAAVAGTAASHVADLFAHRVERLRAAWAAAGLWHQDPAGLPAAERREMAGAARELRHRLQLFRREALLLADRVPPVDRLLIAPLWADLDAA